MKLIERQQDYLKLTYPNHSFGLRELFSFLIHLWHSQVSQAGLALIFLFEKIDDNIQRYDYDNKELTEFKHEIQDVFFSNGKFMMMQQNLNRALDNILF